MQLCFHVHLLPVLALKTVGYAGFFGGTVAAFGGILYTLYSELQGTSGTYPMVQRAVSLIESDPKVLNFFQ